MSTHVSHDVMVQSYSSTAAINTSSGAFPAPDAIPVLALIQVQPCSIERNTIRHV